MSDDKAHEYVPVEWRDWPGDWRERAEKAEAERTQALAALAEMTKERDKWRSIALDSVRGNGQKPDTSERLRREADASHALSSYTVPASGFMAYDDVLAERNNMAEALREVNARLVQVTAERDRERVQNDALQFAIHCLQLAWNNVAAERDAARRWAKAWKAKAKSVREELRGMTAAYDKAVWGAKARIAQLEHELKLYAPYHVMREQRDAALARAEKCEHERALSQQLREDDHR